MKKRNMNRRKAVFILRLPLSSCGHCSNVIYNSLPLSLHGTEFQKRVWRALCDIPYGHSASYQEIAAAAGDIRAARAVGMANNRNHIVIVIPCHRVIGKDGSLVGYGGGLDKKKYLLDLEGIKYKE